jgi:hypothetical protein
MQRILLAILLFSLFTPAIRGQAVSESNSHSANGQTGGATVPPASREQSAQEIANHVVEALGGKDRLQSINSLYLEGKALQPNGTEVSVRIWKVFDRLFRQEMDYGLGKIAVIVTPGKGWISDPRTGGTFKSLPPDQLHALQTEIDPAGCFLDYSAKGSKIERLGTDTLDGRPCYVIKIWFPSIQSITYSIDQKTFYILKETRYGGGIMGGGALLPGWNSKADGMVDISFADYKILPGGYIFPYSITIGGLGKVSVTKVEVNGNINVDALSKPR